MGVSHVFKIVQMVPNRAKNHIYYVKSVQNGMGDFNYFQL